MLLVEICYKTDNLAACPTVFILQLVDSQQVRVKADFVDQHASGSVCWYTTVLLSLGDFQHLYREGRRKVGERKRLVVCGSRFCLAEGFLLKV